MKKSILVLCSFFGLLVPELPAKPGETCQPIRNGVYAVTGEGKSAAEAKPGASDCLLIYDKKYSEADRSEPDKFVALNKSASVPLLLAEAPETGKDERGNTLLKLRLAPDQVKPLEEFTRTHLNGRVAIVIGGEIITMHKVRAVIPDGHVMITRCQDNACESLRMKLVP